jgi:hypothetical protein
LDRNPAQDAVEQREERVSQLRAAQGGSRQGDVRVGCVIDRETGIYFLAPSFLRAYANRRSGGIVPRFTIAFRQPRHRVINANCHQHDRFRLHMVTARYCYRYAADPSVDSCAFLASPFAADSLILGDVREDLLGPAPATRLTYSINVALGLYCPACISCNNG